MASAVSIALLVTSQALASVAIPPGQPSGASVSMMALSNGPQADQALEALGTAREQADAGDIDGALATLAKAIEADPELSSAYLMRAQLLLDRLGDMSQLPVDDQSRADWVAKGKMAVSDVDRYIELAMLEPDAVAQFKQQRDELQAAIDRVQQAAAEAAAKAKAKDDQDDEDDQEDPPPPPPKKKKGRWVVPVSLSLMGAGGMLNGIGMGIPADAIDLRTDCEGAEIDSTCTFGRWEPSDGEIGLGVGLSLAGAALFTTGAVLMARLGSNDPRARQRRRIAGFTLLGTAGAALVTSVALSVAGFRGARSAMGNVDLQRRLDIATGGVVVGLAVPSLLGGGIGLLLPPRAPK